MTALTFEQALKYSPDQPRDARGRWTRGGGSGGSTQPKQPRARQAQQAKPQWSRSMSARAKNDVGRRMSEARMALEAAVRARDEAAAKRAAGKTLDAYDSLRRLPDGVWYDPTFADYAFNEVMKFAGTFQALLIGAHPTLAVAATVLGAYFMVRYVYRKAVTLGAYRGVNKPSSWWTNPRGGD